MIMTEQMNKVCHGINLWEENVAGKSVAQVRRMFAEALVIPPDAKAHIDNGPPVIDEEGTKVPPGACVKFIKQGGGKGLCDLHQDPGLGQPWSQTLRKAEYSLRELGEVIRRCRIAVAIAEGSASGHGSPVDQESEFRDMMRRCAELPKEAISTVESAWENLEANELRDWDAVGREILDLLTGQSMAVAQAAKLLHRGEQGGLPLPSDSHGKLADEESRLLERAQEFRDSWPWSTGNKPDDPEDAAAAQRALQALPSFDVLSRLAKGPPPATVQFTASQPLGRDEAERRMREARTLKDLFDAFQSAPDADEGYDLLKALDENRKGERPLFPPEKKGISW
jgi:hypothetical protein